MQDVSGKVAFVTGAASGIGTPGDSQGRSARAGAEEVMLCDIEEAAFSRGRSRR